jgi:hypothetical protein
VTDYTKHSPGRIGYFSYTQPVDGPYLFTVTTGLLLHLNEYGKNGFFCSKIIYNNTPYVVNNLNYNHIFDSLVSKKDFLIELDKEKTITLMFETYLKKDGSRTIESVDESESEVTPNTTTQMIVTFNANEENAISTITKYNVKELIPFKKEKQTKENYLTEENKSIEKKDHYYYKNSSSSVSKTSGVNDSRSFRRRERRRERKSASKSARKASGTVGKLPKPEKKSSKGGKSKKKKIHTRRKTHKRKTHIYF